MPPLLPFAVASFLPGLSLALACVLGGPWPLIAVLSITVFVFFLDKLPVRPAPTDASGHRLSEILGIAHFPLLGLTVWAIGQDVALLEKVLLVVAAGLYFGQVSNSNAHELIHRADRWAFQVGAVCYASILFGHHASAHRLVHHVHAATPADPATARLGEGFWAYLPRAWLGGYRDGLKAAYALAGGAGVAGLLIVSAYAQIQLMLSDYVQHYGLMRRSLPDGRFEPMGPAHSWNARQWYSAAMMLNAPRHSAHHARPATSFPQLELDTGTMPMLPHSLPVMAVLALVPPLWRRVMDKRVKRWTDIAMQGGITPVHA